MCWANGNLPLGSSQSIAHAVRSPAGDVVLLMVVKPASVGKIKSVLIDFNSG